MSFFWILEFFGIERLRLMGFFKIFEIYWTCVRDLVIYPFSLDRSVPLWI